MKDYYIVILFVFLGFFILSISIAERKFSRGFSKQKMLIAELGANSSEEELYEVESESNEISSENLNYLDSENEEDGEATSVLEDEALESDLAGLAEDELEVDTIKKKQAAPRRAKKWWQFWK